MHAIFRIAALALGMAFLSIQSTAQEDEQFYIDKAKTNLEAASQWVVQGAIKFYYGQSPGALRKYIREEFRVQLWATPLVNHEHSLAQFRIQSRGINYSIHNLYRELINGAYYEFWIVKVVPREWAGAKNRTEFYVSRSKDPRGAREIISNSDKFIASYKLQNGYDFVFPSDDLQMIYIMSPWFFPDHYEGSELEGKRVELDSDGLPFLIE